MYPTQYPSEQVGRPDAYEIPETNIDAFIINLAREHGVTYTPTRADAMAGVIARLSGDEVEQDDIDDLLVALARANVIDGETMLDLLSRHIKEGNHAQSIDEPGEMTN